MNMEDGAQRLLGSLPMPHRRHAEQVLQAIKTLKESHASAPGLTFSRLLQTGSHAVVSICGDRGAGKTTVLEAVCSELRDSTNIVLPTIRPELFSPADSVLGLAIASLEREIRRHKPELLRLEVRSEVPLGSFLTRLLGRASGIAGRDVSEERQQFHSLDAAAEDFVRSAWIGSDFIDQWCRLVEFVSGNFANGFGTSDSALRPNDDEGRDDTDAVQINAVDDRHTGTAETQTSIIIPVDDADLAPELLQRILVDLRIMTSARNVICLACIDLDEAAQALGEHYLKAYANLKSLPRADVSTLSRMNGVVESQLAKAIPPQWRNSIRGLTLPERLEFTPLGSHGGMSIKGLLNGFPLSSRDHSVPNLDYLFMLPTDAEEPSAYAHCLPSSPRELVALHASLEHVSKMDVADGSATRAAVKVLVQYGLNFGIRSSSAIPVRSQNLVDFDEAEDSEIVYLDFTNVTYYPRAKKDNFQIPVLGLESGSEIRVGRLKGITARYGPRDARIEEMLRLHPAVIYCLALLRELTIVHPLFREDVVGGAPAPGRVNSDAVTVAVGREETDGSFLRYPAWDGFYDYFLVGKAWDSVVQHLRGKLLRISDHRTVMAAVTLEWWKLISSVQRARLIPPDTGALIGLLAERSANATDALKSQWQIVWDEVRDTYLSQLHVGTTGDGSIRAQDYVYWVETYLLYACYAPLQHPWFLERTIEARGRLLTEADRASIGNTRFASGMEARLHRVSDERWIGPLIELLTRFDSAAGAQIERLHRIAQEDRLRTVASAAGAASLENSAEVTAPRVHESADLRLYQAAMAALRELESEAHPESLGE